MERDAHWVRVGYVHDDGGTTIHAVFVCPDCGALATHESAELHQLWHEHMAEEWAP